MPQTYRSFWAIRSQHTHTLGHLCWRLFARQCIVVHLVGWWGKRAQSGYADAKFPLPPPPLPPPAEHMRAIFGMCRLRKIAKQNPFAHHGAAPSASRLAGWWLYSFHPSLGNIIKHNNLIQQRYRDRAASPPRALHNLLSRQRTKSVY